MAAPAGVDPRRVLIIDAEGNSFNNPSLKCIVDLLVEKGCQIDLRYAKSPAPMPSLAGARFLPFGSLIRKLKTAVFSRLFWWWLATLGVVVENLLLYREYDLVIGVDRHGLIEASILSRLTGTPFVFLSFEIMFESETSSRYKRMERRASNTVSLWMVQDEVRAGQLLAENRLQPAAKMLLPLASAGHGDLSARRLRDHLHVPADKQVAIVIGSVTGWSMVARILRGVASWPPNWALVVHERHGRTRASLGSDLTAVRSLLGERIFISDSASTTVDDLGSILAGVSVGLAFYEPDFKGFHSGRNLKYLGLASGKISTYLRYGIPVIMNDIGLYAEEARRYQFGRVASDPEAIRDHLDACLDEHYRSNAQDYFSKKLDFDNFREGVWARLRASMTDPERISDA
jgi:hypothetical protein